MNLLLRGLWAGWRGALEEVLAALEGVFMASKGRTRCLALILASTATAWIVYVPVHELLHAFGCMATGGDVRELQIQAVYGGRLLERVFPFVRAGGDYAGRLTQFDTGGSDLILLATDLAPFLLTVLGAGHLLRSARRKRNAFLVGPGLVLAAAPLMSLGGDLYESGSVLVSAGLRAILPGREADLALGLRHDDLTALLDEFGARFPDLRPIWAIAVAASAAAGWIIGNAILALSQVWADRVIPLRPGEPGVV